MLSLLIALTPSASAFCGTYVGSAGAELYNNASQVVVARQGEQTTLTLVNDYQGELLDFAMVIPVPEALTEEQVSLADSLHVARADAYSAPRLVSYECENFDSGYYDDGGGGLGCSDKSDDAGYEDSGDAGGSLDVEVVEAFTVGEYQFVVLDAEASADLYTWLDDQGYALPAGAEALLDEYIEAGSYFLAAKVTLEAVDDAEAWLSPIQIRYDDPAFSLPVRIGTISSPGVQNLTLYAVTDEADGAVGIANYPEVTLEEECMWRSSEYDDFSAFYAEQFTAAVTAAGGAGWITEYSWAPSNCDPCSSDPLSGEELSALGFDGDADEAHFTRLHVQYTPAAATEDLTLYTSGISDTHQVRYITYGYELEDRFPICGEGWAESPGTCDADDEAGSGGCSTVAAVSPRTRWRFGLLALLALTFGGVVARRRV